MTPGKNSKNGKKQGWRSLTVQLITFVIFPLVLVLLLVTFGSVTLHENAMRNLVGERDERAAQMASAAVDDQIEIRLDLARALAIQAAGVRDENLDGLLQKSSDLLDVFPGGAGYVSWNGDIIAGQGQLRSQVSLPGTVLDALAQLKSTPDRPGVVSDAYRYDERSELLAAVLAPDPDGQKVAVGIFPVSEVAEKSLNTILSSGNGVTVWMIDQDGQVLYHAGSSLHDAQITSHAGVTDAFQGQAGADLIEAGGMEHVLAFSPVQGGKWALMIEEPWEHVTSAQLQLTQMAPLVMVPVALLALVGLFIGARQIVQPLQELAKQSEQLGWGDYEAIRSPVGGIEEIRSLQMELVHMAHKVQSAQHSLHSYIGAITAGQEEERLRLARDLHDETIQTIIALKQRLQLAQMDWEGHPVADQLRDLEASAEKTIEEVRRMVRALRPIYLEDIGLVAALNMLANESSRVMGIAVEFNRQGQERRLDGPVELSLYRIVQEALNNIARHAHASRAVVQIAFREDETEIVVEDNGHGFGVPRSPSAFAAGGHFGLLGMHERADLLKARLEIMSEPGQGTTLTVRVPVEDEKKADTPVRG